MSGDLTSAFDFKNPNGNIFPPLPDMGGYQAIEALSRKLPDATAPATPAALYQESGVRPSRALPYALHVHAVHAGDTTTLALSFENIGGAGAVFHVYDAKHLDRIPRRYTVEASKTLMDRWALADDDGAYDLSVYGPNGFYRSFKGSRHDADEPDVEAAYDPKTSGLTLRIKNRSSKVLSLDAVDNAYGSGGPWPIEVAAKKTVEKSWSLGKSERWYDISLRRRDGAGFERRFAGRVENGLPSISDPILGIAT